jgi:predicted  nucleic acid-binding Zn-ribbon protein
MEAVRQMWSDDKLDHLERRVDEGFDRMDREFAKVDTRFEKMEAQFEKIDARFEKMEARFEKVDERFEKIEDRLAKIDEKLGGLAAIDARLKGVEKMQSLFAGAAVSLLVTVVVALLS